MIVSWAWTPTSEGAHILLVRAVISGGFGGISNAVVVSAAASALSIAPQPSPGPVQLDTTLDASQEAEVLAGIQSGTPIPPLTAFSQENLGGNPAPQVEQPPEEPAEQPRNASILPVKLQLWLQGSAFKTTLPAQPVLDGGSNQCDGILLIQDKSVNEAGFFVYRIDSYESTFSRIATLPGKAGKSTFSYHDHNLSPGYHTYYVSAFNAAGEAASNFIYMQITDEQCVVYQIPLYRSRRIIFNPVDPADKMYCYASTDGVRWARLPGRTTEFLQPLDGVVDLGPYRRMIPMQAQASRVNLALDCWGWQGDRLIYEGSASQMLDESTSIGDLIYDLDNTSPPAEIPGDIPPNLEWILQAPTSLHFTRLSCTPSAQNGTKETCSETPDSSQPWGLSWDWQQYPDGCTLPSVSCPQYKPAEGFRLYSTCPNDPNPLLLYENNDPAQTYLKDFTSPPTMRGLDCDPETYVVRAYNNNYGESADSDSTGWYKQMTVTDLLPTTKSTVSYTIVRKGPEYDTQSAYWYTLPENTLNPGYYSFCGKDCYDAWLSARFDFTLPDDMGEFFDAELFWTNGNFVAAGPGNSLVNSDCLTTLSTKYAGPLINYETGNFYKGNNRRVDVASEVGQVAQSAGKTVTFWLTGPLDRWADHSPDQCTFDATDAFLEILYNKQ